MANVCLSCGRLGLLRKGCYGARVCATGAVHKAVCNSHLQGDKIPMPGEGSFAQMIPVSSILCWLTQGGAGQSAASPGAWKKPRCQSWCDNVLPGWLPNVPLCCSCSLGQYLPPCPAPGATAAPNSADPARAGTQQGGLQSSQHCRHLLQQGL